MRLVVRTGDAWEFPASCSWAVFASFPLSLIPCTSKNWNLQKMEPGPLLTCPRPRGRGRERLGPVRCWESPGWGMFLRNINVNTLMSHNDIQIWSARITVA